MSARAAWREVCMAEYRITGDMWKATKFADSVAQRFRAETLREAADAIDSESTVSAAVHASTMLRRMAGKPE